MAQSDSGLTDEEASAQAEDSRHEVEGILPILDLLRRESGLDFTEYKPTTLFRRIERRMNFRQVASLAEYEALAASEQAELQALIDDFLIGVTEFFRDPAVFQFIADEVLPDLLNGRSSREDLRIWSAGCASGEEAYTLAMLAMEAAQKVGFSGSIKVFATDIQPRALDSAALGLYSSESVSGIPQPLLERWFHPDGEGRWRIDQRLRRMVVFARHNLLVDPPFTRIDLAVCRNVLIYFLPEAQAKALSNLHFALRPEGCLLLGGSESAGSSDGAFELLDHHRRFYRKAPRGRLPRSPVGLSDNGQRLPGGEQGTLIDRRLLRDYDALLRRHLPPGMLVDNSRHVLHWFGELSQFLRTPEGRVDEDVLSAVREELRVPLGLALRRAQDTHGCVSVDAGCREIEGVPRLVTITVDCVQDDRSVDAHYHVMFALDKGIDVAGGGPVGEAPEVAKLERELEAMRDRLQQTIADLQGSNERLDLANEELTASNEELQSTNEELKSVNEDLYALNAELEDKNDALVQLNRDYDNLLASTEIGTVFLDGQLNIRKFSPAISRFLQLLPQDVGRSIGHIAYQLHARDDLLADLAQVAASGERIEREIQDGEGHWFLKRVLPFRDEHGRHDGVVLTFTDLTAIRTVEAEREHLRKILDVLPDAVYIVSADHGLEYVNPVLERQLGPVDGRKCHQYIHGLESPCAWCKNDQVFAGQAVRWEWHSPKGKVFDLFDMPFANMDGSVSKFQICHDITQNKQALAQLERSQSLLARSRDYYLSVMENFPTLMWRAGLDGQFNYVNQTWLAFTGRPLAQELGEGWLAGVHPGDRARYSASYESKRATREPFAVEYRLRRHDGEYRWMLDMGRPLLDLEGEFAGYIGACFDIHDRKEAEERLRLGASVFKNSGEGIMITDDQLRIIDVNRAFTEATGYSLEDIFGKKPRVLSSGYHDPEFYRRMWQSLESAGYWQGEIWNKRKDGEVFPEWLGISRVCDSAGVATHYVGIFADITERKANEARIEYMAHHDPLTGLPNRLLFRERFDMAMAYAERNGTRAALLFLDLDHFKAINDSLGHSMGDELLREVAKRLKECMRETDTISRQGGDEFLVVLGDVGEVDAIGQVCQKMLDQLGAPFFIFGHELAISLSIGAAIYPDDGKTFDDLLKKADTAMYHAKEAGRNAYRFFTEKMNVDALERLNIQNSLRRALARGEFVLHFQPQVELHGRRVVGAEALIRWRGSDGQLVAPNNFIPVAEESGLIVPIGEWVIAEACRQAASWQRAGNTEITVAVNLSAIQFRRGDVEQTVIKALAESGLPPRCLELELTESLLISDTDFALTTVQRLKALGVRLSIDDFGTGYSSLAYLKRLSVDKLKIDQSFVRDIGHDFDAASIVRAIVQMARSLNLRTIAEGVEDERLIDYLRVYHCDEAQGYHFAKPMPADMFEQWLQEYSA